MRQTRKFNEAQVWKCCGKYYSKNVKRCQVCGQGVDSCPIGNAHSKPEPGEQVALVKKSQIKTAFQSNAGRFLVTIERHGRRLDGDNFIGGAKQLRDAIAEALGKKGDGERDGLEFRYLQCPAKEKDRKTIIRIKQII